MVSIKEELKLIVGAEYVFDNAEKLEWYAKDHSLEKPITPSYVAQPHSAEEVQGIVKLANRTKLPVYPCSSGIHFFGNSIPKMGGLVIDLRRMNKIKRINTRDRIAMVEPGVTWSQLQKELGKECFFALNPLLPHPEKSVLTSHLEREKMLIPKYEYSDNLLTTEVVLPNGELFRTGSASVMGYPEKSIATGVHPEGPGADWWRLFQGAQGTMGILTWANVKIELIPPVSKTFFIPFKKVEEATRFIYSVQHHMMGNECLLLNKVNLAAILGDKWPEDFQNLQKTLPPWTVILVLAGGKRLSEERIAYEEEALKKIAIEQFIPVLPTSLEGIFGAEKQFPELLRNSWPQEKPYWKFASKGASQDVFFITVMSKAGEYCQLIENVAAKYGYPSNEIGYYLQPVERGRVCHFEANFFYCPDGSEEVRKIKELHSEVTRKLFKAEAFFSQPYGELAAMVFDKAGNYAMAIKKIKTWLDPNNIMAPERLNF
jgi:FAD/FMN-containing dehydrogenase